MKALLTLASLTALLMTGCACDGITYTSVGYVSPAYRYQQRCYQPQTTYFVGPQYYRTYDYNCGSMRYRNYSDAPVIVNRPYGSSVIVPRSWN